MSLVELIVVVSLLGIFAGAAMMRLGRSTFGDTGAKFEASVLTNAISLAQASAVRTGQTHGVVLSRSQAIGNVWSTVRRESGDIRHTIDEHLVHTDVEVVTQQSEVWFDFEGHGTAPFTVVFRGPNRQYKVDVVPFSQSVRVNEL